MLNRRVSAEKAARGTRAGEKAAKRIKLSAWESNPARARVVLIVDIMTSANVTNTPAKMPCYIL